MESNYCKIVSETLSGQRASDERSSNATVILSERLERLKSLSSKFAEIELSPAVKKLLRNNSKVAVC